MQEEDKKSVIAMIKKLCENMIYSVNIGCSVKITDKTQPDVTKSIMLYNIDGYPDVVYTMEYKVFPRLSINIKSGDLLAVLHMTRLNIKQMTIAGRMNRSQAWVSSRVKIIKYILEAFAKGKTDAEVAEMFEISAKCVEEMRKLYPKGKI